MLIARNICAAVLAVIHATLVPVFLLGQLSHDLDGIRDRQEVYKADVLVADDLDLINVTIAGEAVAKGFFGEAIVQIAKVDIASSTMLLNGLHDRRRNDSRLAPSNAQLLIVKVNFAQLSIGMEGSGDVRIKERDESARLVWQDLDAFDWAIADLRK